MIEGAKKLPLRHITIRVPWHDNKWNGSVCNNPKGNSSCLILKRIGQEKKEDQEAEVTGKRFNELKQERLPPCKAERATFMADFSWTRTATHAYQKTTKTHKHYRPTKFEHPPYSAAAVPYAWMMNTNVESNKDGPGLAEILNLEYQPEREPSKEELGFETIWIQEHQNQLVMLDTFFGALQPKESLCFFYAKKTPLSESSKRVIIGVGRVLSVGNHVEYDYEGKGSGLRSVLWERNVSHSIRPTFHDGFILPYHEILEKAQSDPSINMEDFLAFAPDENFTEYSMGSEHIEHSGAIQSLLNIARALRKSAELVGGDWEPQLNWIDKEVNRLWDMRGAYPGFGSALTAIGIKRGTLIAHRIEDIMANLKGESLDPWNFFEKEVEAPDKLKDVLAQDIIKLWRKMGGEHKSLLKLISRFSITKDQAIRIFQPSKRKKIYGKEIHESQLLNNPYMIYEIDRQELDKISVEAVDQGLFPEAKIQNQFPLPKPLKMEGPLDARRVRALFVNSLEVAADEGNTLMRKDWCVEYVRGMPLNEPCPIGPGSVEVAEETFENVIKKVDGKQGQEFYQLDRYVTTSSLIRSTVRKRLKGRRHHLIYDWLKIVNDRFGEIPSNYSEDEREKELKAREEKAKALEQIANSRLSVLVGAAGTGKTSLLRMLCELTEVKNKKIRLLAPTGKARVRLETQTGLHGAMTIAQYLGEFGRYKEGRYLVTGSNKTDRGYNTIIIDESSMMTEEQFASILDAIRGGTVERIVLVGDPRQLPPIGAGRPFVDIVSFLKPENVDRIFPRVAESYGELTAGRRQQGKERPDVLLSKFFSGESPSVEEEDVFITAPDIESEFIKLVKWETEEELEGKLFEELKSSLNLKEESEETDFEQSIGGSLFKGRVYFRNEYNGNEGAASKAEAWQILSPTRPRSSGVDAINRQVQSRFRKKVWDWIDVETYYFRKVPQPMGPQRILYGDKVINVTNIHKSDVFPKPERKTGYVANGDIGIVVGQYKSRSSKMKGLPKKLEVEFSSQTGYRYKYGTWEFGDDSSNPLELAYALTIHKSQGTQFGVVFLVLPNPCWLLSRELIYTALTRQQDRIVILHQGNWSNFRVFADADRSDIVGRFTNLFIEPSPIEVTTQKGKRFLEEYLIHKTMRGDLVRSKSEVIIANALYQSGIKDYQYESIITGKDGSQKYPDFLISDQDSGEQFVWEHLGLMNDLSYATKWKEKKKWYLENGIAPIEEGGGPNGALIITVDDSQGGIDSTRIQEIINKILEG